MVGAMSGQKAMLEKDGGINGVVEKKRKENVGYIKQCPLSDTLARLANWSHVHDKALDYADEGA